MFKAVVLQAFKLQNKYICEGLKSFSTSIYDPPYLDSLKPKVPVYDQINIQMKGYDFVLLENFQKTVHKIASTMELDISNGWATPASCKKIQKFKPNSAVIDNEYNLTDYERNIQVMDLPSNMAPILFELIQASVPQGISFSLHPHKEEYEKIRYVPDMELKQLKGQLDVLGGPAKKK